ncbi:hypothetical protein Pelo_1722 [Pelomyxa schiedti]|nr:hypothetical protein Pelo_1722 [Pelomyxa schiedti]
MGDAATPTTTTPSDGEGWWPCGFSGMPEHVIKLVLSFLDCVSLRNVSATCKSLRLLANDEVVWEGLAKVLMRVAVKAESSWKLAVLRWERCDFFDRGREFILKIEQLQGCASLISEAYKFAGIHEEAMPSIMAIINELLEYYKFGQELNAKCKVAVSSIVTLPPTSSSFAWSVLDFCQMLEFAIKFDNIKMSKPHLQNTLAYYHRLLDTMPEDSKKDSSLINSMAFFFANSDPMTRELQSCITHLMPLQVLDKLVLLANSYACMLTPDPGSLNCLEHRLSTIFFCDENLAAYALTGSLVLWDRCSPTNPYLQSSNIGVVKEWLDVLQNCSAKDKSHLISTVKYSSLYLNVVRRHASTPDNLRQFLLSLT